ncbi:MAG: hypothetical protein A3I66_22945 [Burkholderiales bacterium RIFCSPLOWO2_02_FULL_57_36]|nr:MAG: hypothetical protein A3I66_22945 [Burkholderiales bacterium RIFCSPLOWO2_02_FULL_57_36]
MGWGGSGKGWRANAAPAAKVIKMNANKRANMQISGNPVWPACQMKRKGLINRVKETCRISAA